MPRNGIKIVGSSLYPLILSRFNEFLLAIGSNGFVSTIRVRYVYIVSWKMKGTKLESIDDFFEFNEISLLIVDRSAISSRYLARRAFRTRL